MRLSKLELSGFKSFVEQTKFSFAKGLTGIVGPNGCGKSNISDAIHWVLGEQNARKLRGYSMKDVIFKGTKNKPPYNFTEVSITIDNDKKILPIDYEEVKITRKAYRNGESEYLINDKPCRLKDILNLFYDTGMGRRAYSFMELQMVDELLSSDDKNKRYLFEEAAGIMKYKQSQKLSENKLDSIENDLIRLNDIMTEVKHQLNVLRHQVSKAKRYKNLKKKINKIHIQLTGIKFFKLQEALKPIKKKHLEIEKEVTYITKEISKTTNTYNDKNNELLNVEKNLNEKQKHLKEIEKKINEYEKKILLNRQQIENSKSTLKNNLNRIKNIKNKNSSSQELLERDKKSLISIQKKISQNQIEKEKLQTDLNSLNNNISKMYGSIKSLEEKIYEYEILKQKYAKEKSEFNTRLNILSDEEKTLQDKIKDYRTKSEKFSRIISESKEKILDHTSEKNQTLKKKDDILQENRLLKEKMKGLEEKIYLHQIEIKTIKNEQKQLEKWEKEFSGFQEGTKKVIKYFSNNKKATTLTDALIFEDKYTTIIENALRTIINSAICSDDHIDEILEILKKEKLNSSIILTNISSKKNNNLYKSIRNLKSAIPLTSIIKFKYSNHNLKLFENMFLVKDNKTARALAKINFDFPAELFFITNSGELFSTYGRIKTNWDINSQEGLLSRKKTLQNIQCKIDKKENIIKEIESKNSKLYNKIKENKASLVSIDEKLKKIKNRTERYKEKELNLKLYLKNFVNLEKESEENIKDLEEKIKKIKHHLNQVELQIQKIPHKDNKELKNKKKDIQEKLSKIRKKRYDIESKLQDYNIEIAKLEKDQTFTKENIKKTKYYQNENVMTIKQLESSLEPQKIEIYNLEDSTREIEKKLQIDIDKLKKFQESYRKLENKFHTLRNKTDDQKVNLHELEFKKDILNKNKTSLELKIQESKLNLEHIKENVLTRFHYDLSHDNFVDYKDLDLQELNNNLAKNQKTIAKMGPINLAAIDDYETQKKRYKFLREQRQDLIESKDKLKSVIKELNNTAKNMFLHTFKKIQKNFEKIHNILFSGGRGIIKLEDPNNPLESKIDIYSNPKGKKITNINLLSSGEKALTAISLLFAIYLVKPSPFCVLDEIDAPLDETNINRFLKLLDNFSKDTQFIIITHNKRTIEAVDYLYGLTMEEDGVSKIISVDLS